MQLKRARAVLLSVHKGIIRRDSGPLSRAQNSTSAAVVFPRKNITTPAIVVVAAVAARNVGCLTDRQG